MTGRSLGSRYWERRLRRWPASHPLEEGYTLLLPVPGDLPVFLELALAASSNQASAHRRATIVIPDQPTPEIDRIVARHQPTWADPLTIRLIRRPERWILPILKSGSRNHGLQLIEGISAARTSHVVLHDADLFPLSTDLLEQQYLSCRARDLACLGLTGVWDPWYGEKGLRLAATWDLVARVEWFRRFSPYQHIGHDGPLLGEQHTFDTTLLPQSLTEPAAIDHSAAGDSFVHFNYVISAYRLFQREGAGYLDDRFLMLFISLMIDVLGVGGTQSSLPTSAVMAASLGSTASALRFPAPAAAKERYEEFRSKLALLLVTSWLPADGVARIAPTVARFDDYYG